MSTITKELAKLFRKITNSEIDAEGNAHVVLSPADSLLINNARIALASLEAEPVAWAHRLINKRNGVVHPWVYGSAEACPSEGDIFNIEVMPLYTVPPAPVSVPAAMEIDDDFDSAFEHGKAVGWNAYRAAMLQGAKPVTTAYKLRDAVETIRNSGIEIDAEKIFAERDALNAPDCWCRTCRPVTISDMRFVVCPECGNKRCPHANDHRNACTGSNEPGQEGSAYPAAPQQEVNRG
ncbi:hypothetical protein [Escherichia coli]|uniref:hypothetical protein n=1 Tax=Escherichia coli TaxID=562 RepID=UPI002113D747|nr:hypothetical protein [Escherichia coli]MCQ6978281.1 hypothetical protein [Escherichia coli]